MAILSAAAGAMLVLIALRDIFDTLFHPQGRGTVSEHLIKGIWRVMRKLVRGNHRLLSLSGPLAFIAVIVAWTVLVVVGFALILWPHFPEDFIVVDGIDADAPLLDALYISMVNLTSLGYGDIVPKTELLRFLGPLETLIGLGLMTASISWILLLYRVLSDFRSLSHEVSLLAEAEMATDTGLSQIEPEAASRILADLTSKVVAVRDDFVHSPIAYYFHPRDPRHALPVLLPRLITAIEDCSRPDRARGLRLQAAMFLRALDDLLETVAEDFAGTPASNTAEALAAYRHDHLWEPE